MAVRFYKGDLIEDANVDIVCHQTNCRGVMGAGIAKQTRDNGHTEKLHPSPGTVLC